MSKRAFLCLPAITLLVGAQGCMEPSSPAVAVEELQVRQGRLHFRDANALLHYVDEVGHMERADLDAWEESLGFVSLRHAFTTAMEAELRISDKYEELSARTGLRPEDVPVEHSPEYLQLVQTTGVRVVHDEAGDHLDYNLKDPVLASLVDTDGELSVGDTVFHFDADSGLEQIGFTSSPFGSSEDSSAPGYSTLAMAGECCTLCVSNSYGYDWSGGSGWVSTGNRQASLFTVTGSSMGSGAFQQNVVYSVRIRSERKNFWGKWVAEAVPTTISGSWSYAYSLWGAGGECNIMQFNSGASSYYTSPSPFYWSGPISEVTFPLEPQGTWVPGSSTWQFWEAFNVPSYSFTVTANGTTFVVTR